MRIKFHKGYAPPSRGTYNYRFQINLAPNGTPFDVEIKNNI